MSKIYIVITNNVAVNILHPTMPLWMYYSVTVGVKAQMAPFITIYKAKIARRLSNTASATINWDRGLENVPYVSGNRINSRFPQTPFYFCDAPLKSAAGGGELFYPSNEAIGILSFLYLLINRLVKEYTFFSRQFI